MFKRLHNWTIKWAASKNGWIALFVLSVCEAVFFPVLPDFLLIPLIAATPKKAYRYALISLIGTFIGACGGYLLGSFLWVNANGSFTNFAQFFFDKIPGFSVESYYNIQKLYEQWNFWLVSGAAFAPIPYKLFTITAGVFNISFWMFLVASIIGRGGRIFLVATITRKNVNAVNRFIEKYFPYIAIGFIAFLIIIIFMLAL